MQAKVARVHTFLGDRHVCLCHETLILLKRCERGFLPRSIAIEGKDNFSARAVIGDHAAYHFNVPCTEGGAAGCYGSFDACQVCRHNIGIALDDDDLFGFGHLTFGKVDAVEHLRFFV